MWLSYNDIEQIGMRVNKAYKKLPSLSGQFIQRVEPERMAREVCKLTVDFCHLSRDRNTLGMTSFEEYGVEVCDDEHGSFYYMLDGKTILIEQDLAQSENQRGRYHFTVMHETAHQILKLLFPGEYSDVCHRVYRSTAYRQTGTARDWEEWQADNLASVLLLPADLVISTAVDFGLSGGIKILNRVFYSDVYERFSAMAERLGASRQALAIRMKRLGLLEREYLKDPYALVDIVKEENEP